MVPALPLRPRAWTCCFLCFLCLVMYNKRSLDDTYAAEIPLQMRFREDMRDVFLSNDVSGARAARMIENAILAGAQHLETLCVNTQTHNASRDLLRRSFRGSKWPSPYVFTVRALNPATNIGEMKKFSILLPHELLFSILKINEPEPLLQQQRQVVQDRPDLQAHIQKLRDMGFPDADEVLLMSLWADAVPFSHDRTQSIESYKPGPHRSRLFAGTFGLLSKVLLQEARHVPGHLPGTAVEFPPLDCSARWYKLEWN